MRNDGLSSPVYSGSEEEKCSAGDNNGVAWVVEIKRSIWDQNARTPKVWSSRPGCLQQGRLNQKHILPSSLPIALRRGHFGWRLPCCQLALQSVPLKGASKCTTFVVILIPYSLVPLQASCELFDSALSELSSLVAPDCRFCRR